MDMNILDIELAKVSTYHLLKALDDFRVFHHAYNRTDTLIPDGPWSAKTYRGTIIEGKLYLDIIPEWPDAPLISYEKLKEELSTREHVPNKAELKKIRQEKARQRQGKSIKSKLGYARVSTNKGKY